MPRHHSKPKEFKSTSQKKTVDKNQKAVLQTLAYKSIFGAQVTKSQLWNYLISEEPLDPLEFEAALNWLCQEKAVIKKGSKNELFSIPGAKYADFQSRLQDSQALIKKARSICAYLQKLPWIKMMAVTGSTAAFNSGKTSDIDLLIVTSSKRLWLTRFFVVLILKSLRIYWDQNKPAGTVCPNIYLTENNLAWSKNKRSVYTANEISMAIPIFEKDGMYFNFLHHNQWAGEYLPNLIPTISNAREYFKNYKHPATKFRLSPIGLLEKLMMWAQKKYMKKKLTKETIKKDFIHFNKHDHTEDIIQKYQKKVLTF